MTAIAPLSVLVLGMLGLLIVLGAVARIVVLERRLHTAAVVPAPVVSPAAPYTGSGLAA